MDSGGCECAHGHSHGSDEISRRTMLAASVSAVAAGAALASSATSSAAPQGSPTLPENALITLGVQAGPPPVPNRTGISSALKIGDAVDQIDCGLGSLNAFANAGLHFDNLTSMFITHLHTDHIVDYFSFFLSGGYTASKGKAPVTVYGPGPAGVLPPSQVGDPDPATIEPQNPTPGLVGLSEQVTDNGAVPRGRRRQRDRHRDVGLAVRRTRPSPSASIWRNPVYR
jgi:hypothetical protein